MSFYSAANRRIFDAVEGVDVSDAEPVELAVTVELDGDLDVIGVSGSSI